MKLEILRLKIAHETDMEKLREYAQLLTKVLGADRHGGGWCVVNDHNRPYSLYDGSREECVAFIEGYDSAPAGGQGCFDRSVLCVCVDVPSKPIVIPEDRFGELLGA